MQVACATGIPIDWGSCDNKDTRVQSFRIGSTAIDLPDFVETRIENDTLVAFPPRTDFANLRFAVISVTKDGKEEVLTQK